MGDFSKTCSQIDRRLSAVGWLAAAGSMTLTRAPAIEASARGLPVAITTVHLSSASWQTQLCSHGIERKAEATEYLGHKPSRTQDVACRNCRVRPAPRFFDFEGSTTEPGRGSRTKLPAHESRAGSDIAEFWPPVPGSRSDRPARPPERSHPGKPLRWG